MSERASVLQAADRLDEEARRAIRRLDDLLPIMAGRPLYVSLHSSLTYLREGLNDAATKYERERTAE